MILADKIIEERKKNGWSQEELADKLSVSRQSVSKWESAQSTPDLARVIRMAELFGVTTDYLLRDDMEAEVQSNAPAMPESDRRIISMEEAGEFLEFKRESAGRISAGVSLCIISPTLLIFLAGLSEIGRIKEGVAAAVGMSFLLALVAVAVFTFISYSVRGKRFEYLENEDFETAYGVTGLAREKKRDFEKTYALGIGMGVVLCIVAAVPLITAAAMEAPEAIVVSMTSVLLLLVALGVNRIVRVCIINESFEQLLQEGEYTGYEKKLKKKLDLYQTIYWCSVTAVYLGWSFAGNRWDFTWIVWPVAAVFNAAAIAIVRMVIKE